MQMGILFTIIDIFRSWEKRKNILEFASGPDKLRLGDLMLEVLKVSAYNNRKNQIQIFFSLVHLFDPVKSLNHFRLSIMKNVIWL